MTETDLMKRTVAADIDLDVTGPGRVVFQVAVVRAPGLEVHENFVLTLDGTVISAREVIGVTGSRFHVVEPQPGRLLLSYTATVTGRAEPPEVLEHELIEYLRPSRYAEIGQAGRGCRARIRRHHRPGRVAGRGGGLGRRAPQLRVRQQ